MSSIYIRKQVIEKADKMLVDMTNEIYKQSEEMDIKTDNKYPRYQDLVERLKDWTF
jgi:hypothetical protein